ncbi:MAG: prepilin-type N-terminal cleavage/methylation domain-containing protein [Patescibacteria group bacterium]
MPKIVSSLWFIVHSLRKKFNRPRTTNHEPRTKPAFTLIEILVVVGIMAVLASAILYSTNNAREKGKDARRKGDLSAVASALTAYFTDNHHYPPTDLVANPSLDYVSYPYSESWIPNLAGYLDKLPKDPLQTSVISQLANIVKTIMNYPYNQQTAANGQVAATNNVSYSVTASADDGKYISSGPSTGFFDTAVSDVPVGKPFETNCLNTRNSFMMFRNVNIPAGKTISSATITFSMRNAVPPYSMPQPDSFYDANTPVKTKFRAEKTLTPASPADGSGWATEMNKAHTTETIPPDIVVWNPPGTVSFDITSSISDLNSLSGWAGPTPRDVLLFWLDNGTPLGSCAGRIGVSYDGSVTDPGDPARPIYGNAPKLDITYADVITPPSTCTDPLATNTGDPLPCTYPPITTGACDNFATNVYCYRTSTNQKVFVLWTKLENANDPELYGNANAKCIANDFDPVTNPASPYLDLGIPNNSAFNYCIKSPQ